MIGDGFHVPSVKRDDDDDDDDDALRDILHRSLQRIRTETETEMMVNEDLFFIIRASLSTKRLTEV